MPVLEIYISWVNSVLAEGGGEVNGVEDLQDGKVLCELIDILVPNAGLLAKVKASGDCRPLAYINEALQHMKGHGIKIRFSAEDILHSEVKSMLDVQWILILNYGIHSIGEDPQHRSVGEGKKNLLEWCQKVLETTFDAKDTLSFSLCRNNCFIKLLEVLTQHSVHKLEDKTEYVDALLKEIEDHYFIKKDIIKASDIVDGTVDEHTVMIYLSLLRRRTSRQRTPSYTSDYQRSESVIPAQVSGQSHDEIGSDEQRSTMAKLDMRKPHVQDVPESKQEPFESFSIVSLSSEPKHQDDPFISGNGFQVPSLNERAAEDLPGSGSDRDKGKELESQMVSEKETDTLSELPTNVVNTDSTISRIQSAVQQLKDATQDVGNEAYSNPRETFTVSTSSSHDNVIQNPRWVSAGSIHRQRNGELDLSPAEQQSLRMPEKTYWETPREENVSVKIRRPKDYIRQWEDTMDRLSGVSVVDEFGSPRSPLISSYRVRLPLRSKSVETRKSSYKSPVQASFGKSCTLDSRSKSSDILHRVGMSSQNDHSIILNTDPVQSYRNKIPTAFTEKSSSSTEEFKIIPEYMHGEQDSRSARPSAKIMEGDTNLAGEHIHATVPKDSFNSQKIQPVSSAEATEQIKLMTRSNSEPSVSNARVRFQLADLMSQHINQPHLKEPQALDDASALSMSHISPWRPTISSLELPGRSERESDALLPSALRSHSVPSQKFLIREQVDDILSPQVGESLEKFDIPSSPFPKEEQLMADNDLKTWAENDNQQSRVNVSSACPVTDNTDYPEQTYRSIQTLSESLPESLTEDLNSSTRWDLSKNYVSYVSERAEDIQAPIRNGGAGRVPRREAWELERRRKEDTSVLSNGTDYLNQTKLIESLYREIEVLKQKVETLEKNDATHYMNVGTKSSTGADGMAYRASYEIKDENRVKKPGHYKKILVGSGMERATSCPHLQPSRRSKATRSLSRIDAKASDVSEHDTVTRNVDSTHLSLSDNFSVSPNNSVSGHKEEHDLQREERRGLDYRSPSHSMNPDIWGSDLSTPGDFEPDRQDRWKQLISCHDLSGSEVIELKQALAYTVAENNILQAKLNNARQEVHDKLKHTNGVLDDCRCHLARAQAENMELRTMLGQEKKRSESFGSKNKELERNISEVKKENKQLESDLDQTSVMLDHSLTKTIPGIDALEAENSRLLSRLTSMEHENDDLKEEIHILKRNQIKAMNTMDNLRECLSKVRRERHELFSELASMGGLEEKSPVRKTDRSLQEKGVQDEWESKENEGRMNNFKHDSGETIFPDTYYSSSFDNRDFDNVDRIAQRLSGQYEYDPLQDSLHSSGPRQHYQYYSQTSVSDREIYPHRKGYVPRSRSCSPHHAGRSASSPGYYNPEFTGESYFDMAFEKRGNNMRQKHKFVPVSGQFSQKPQLSYSPDRFNTFRYSSSSPSHIWARRNLYSRPYSTHTQLNRSFSSAEDLLMKRRRSPSPFLRRNRPSLINSRSRSRENIVTAGRSYSPAYTRHSGSRRDGLQHTSLESNHGNIHHRNLSPEYHFPPTDNGCSWYFTKTKRRPRHSEIKTGEVPMKYENEFDEEDKLVNFLSKSSFSQRKPWSDMQSESDGEDTGINSSMSSRSSFEYIRTKTPLLTDEQRRYADELIRKYTGNSKQYIHSS